MSIFKQKKLNAKYLKFICVDFETREDRSFPYLPGCIHMGANNPPATQHEVGRFLGLASFNPGFLMSNSLPVVNYFQFSFWVLVGYKLPLPFSIVVTWPGISGSGQAFLGQFRRVILYRSVNCEGPQLVWHDCKKYQSVNMRLALAATAAPKNYVMFRVTVRPRLVAWTGWLTCHRRLATIQRLHHIFLVIFYYRVLKQRHVPIACQSEFRNLDEI